MANTMKSVGCAGNLLKTPRGGGGGPFRNRFATILKHPAAASQESTRTHLDTVLEFTFGRVFRKGRSRVRGVAGMKSATKCV